MKQIPDEDVAAKESVKMVQRQEAAVVAIPCHGVVICTGAEAGVLLSSRAPCFCMFELLPPPTIRLCLNTVVYLAVCLTSHLFRIIEQTFAVIRSVCS